MKKLVGLMAILSLVFVSCAAGKASDTGAPGASTQTPRYSTLTPAETKKFLADNPTAVLLDVRTPQEYAQIRIPGSVLIPDFELDARMGSELPDLNAPIIVYCRSGNRSRGAALKLLHAGYTRVYDAGGINAWPYETESGEPGR